MGWGGRVARYPVIPAQTEIRSLRHCWIPAYAGMTVGDAGMTVGGWESKAEMTVLCTMTRIRKPADFYRRRRRRPGRPG